MTEDAEPGGRRRPGVRERLRISAAHLLAAAAVGGGLATVAAHPDLKVILAQVTVLASSATRWSVQRRYQRMREERDRRIEEIAARAIDTRGGENLRLLMLLLLMRTRTYPDEYGPPPTLGR